MDVQKCEALIFSVSLGSFSAAGQKLGYTASGIAKMVNALEQEVGFPLVRRTNKGIILTEDGKKMMPIFGDMVKAQEKAEQVSNEINGMLRGSVTVGSYYSIASNWLPEVIRKFQTDYPKIKINTIQGYNKELLSMLENRQIDCCFFAENKSFKGDWIPLQQDELVVWLPKGHKMARAKSYPIEELKHDPVIYYRPGYDTELDRLLKEEKIRPNVKFSTADSFTTYQMVGAGLGVTVDNKLLAQSWNGDVVLLPLENPKFITLGIAVPSLEGASPATKKFIQCAEEILKK